MKQTKYVCTYLIEIRARLSLPCSIEVIYINQLEVVSKASIRGSVFR